MSLSLRFLPRPPAVTGETDFNPDRPLLAAHRATAARIILYRCTHAAVGLRFFPCIYAASPTSKVSHATLATWALAIDLAFSFSCKECRPSLLKHSSHASDKTYMLVSWNRKRSKAKFPANQETKAILRLSQATGSPRLFLQIQARPQSPKAHRSFHRPSQSQ